VEKSVVSQRRALASERTHEQLDAEDAKANECEEQ
jgi:hypothetical protein